MAEQLYAYAVARIRSKELQLLGRSDVDQLLNCKSEKECLKLLAEKGWGKTGEESSEAMLKAEREKTWDLMKELVEDTSVFDMFLYTNDYHNLKAAVKQVYTDTKDMDIYIAQGTIEIGMILDAVREHNFSALPEHMRSCAEEAFQVLLHTGDSQLCDVILDRAALEMMLVKCKESKVELLARYGELRVAAADISIAIRGNKTHKSKEFLERAMAGCSSLDKKKLGSAALESLEAIYQYLQFTDYSDAVEAIKESSSAFERWCDNRIMDLIRPQKSNPFTISPLAAYILARENEIKTVRILLSGKRNDIPDSAIRERMRDMYV